ncbi:sodium:solute symporter family protein [Agrococcus jejuensis]|uniref:sodium:solute symporter family protein n=1 Tax=Agrococcus jejuensis TaxID=399736 RepID=UPI0011A2C04F|nr:sodium:solute symporter family protein [Agrococcus jejuensis]
MNVAITAVIVAYLVAMFLVAAWLRRRVKDDTDFLLAGRRMGPTIIAIMLLATNFGGAFVLGTSQDAYSVGFAAISFAIGICAGLVVLALFVAKRVRGGDFVTVPDLLQHRFSSTPVRLIASALSIVALTGILAGQVGAVAQSMTALGLSTTWGAVIGTALIVAFTVLSGMWGVAVTDVIQFVVIVGGLVLVAVMAVQEAGGFEAIAATFAQAGVDEPFNPLSQGWSFLLGAALPVVVHKLVGQDVMQRVFAARSARAAALGAGIAGVLTALFAVVPAIAGMAARTIFPELDPSVGVIPALIEGVLPVWAAGILVAAIISAVISTADALLLAAVSNITNDFLMRMRRIREDDVLRLRWSRVLTIVLGVLALGFSLLVPGIIQILTMAFTMYGSGVFVSFMLGLFTRFGGRRAALASMLVGSATALLGLTGVVVAAGVPTIVVAVAASLVAYVVVALVAGERRVLPTTAPVEEAQVARA